ncbi:unnamed protein product [Phytophthora lilii]|uniref:Unnamed protein product n=1 Tax=Phytophthora lilii TaxID=2077276 RepID=A0A9W6WXW5_9STRA|nr:unnamed protein product [Phytophthora lilii]
MVPTFSYSDTEDDDFSSEDGSAHSRPQSFHDLNDIPDNLSAADFEKLTDANSTNNTLKHEDTTIEPPPELQESSKKDNILVKEAVDVANKDVTLPPTKMTSRSLRKRKKREEKVTAPPAETTRRTNKSRSKSVCVPDLVNDAVLSQEYELEEPLPALVCITIAAAAGTLAAVLCVFYN